jgi:hypothetical protein
MRSHLLTVTLLSALAAASPHEKRQGFNLSQFFSAANELISNYVPQSVFSQIAPAIGSAASEAGVQFTNVEALITSAIQASEVPSWFTSAIPQQYQSQIGALGSAVGSLRPAATAPPGNGEATATQTVEGTATVTTAVPASFTTFTDDTGSTITSALGGAAGAASSGVSEGISGASSVATEASGAISEGVSGASSVATVVSGGLSEGVSGASSVATVVSGGIESVASRASSALVGGSAANPSSTAAAARITAGAVGLAVGAAGAFWAL